jgi:hypothetical protein
MCGFGRRSRPSPATTTRSAGPRRELPVEVLQDADLAFLDRFETSRELALVVTLELGRERVWRKRTD